MGVSPCDMDLSLGIHENIHFAPYAKFGQIDSRFHREASSRHDPAFLVRFQVVHVGAVAVSFLTNGVAQPMNEIVTVSRLVDHIAGGFIHLPTLQNFVVFEGLANPVNGGIAGLGHNAKDLRVFLGNFRADKTGPCLITEDAARLVHLGP